MRISWVVMSPVFRKQIFQLNVMTSKTDVDWRANYTLSNTRLKRSIAWLVIVNYRNTKGADHKMLQWRDTHRFWWANSSLIYIIIICSDFLGWAVWSWVDECHLILSGYLNDFCHSSVTVIIKTSHRLWITVKKMIQSKQLNLLGIWQVLTRRSVST